jgi:hypothetical protein
MASPAFRLSFVQPRRRSSVTALVSARQDSFCPRSFFAVNSMTACGFVNLNAVTDPLTVMLFASSKNTTNE